MNIEGDWGYVANQTGGFNGFWWHRKEDTDSIQYLQLEHEKLCFKIKVSDKEKRVKLRFDWCQKMLGSCSEYKLPFKKPKRFGNGTYMTVAVLNNYIVTDENGIIDIEGTIQTLRKAEDLLDAVTANI
ncbi:hypothetical protein ACFQDF_24135 [Ectobacillus funiculus]